jgi:hypothetical protein
MNPIFVSLSPEPGRVRILVQTPERELLKAVLGPVSHSHPRAAATLLEGLALWHQRQLSVVVCADESGHASASELYDALGMGDGRLHYEVGVAFHSHPHGRRVRLRGLGDFRDLRQLTLLGVKR